MVAEGAMLTRFRLLFFLFAILLRAELQLPLAVAAVPAAFASSLGRSSCLLADGALLLELELELLSLPSLSLLLAAASGSCRLTEELVLVSRRTACATGSSVGCAWSKRHKWTAHYFSNSTTSRYMLNYVSRNGERINATCAWATSRDLRRAATSAFSLFCHCTHNLTI